MVVALAAPAAPARAADTVVLRTQEWAPYQMIVDHKATGIAVDSVRCILDRMGLRSEISVLPWGRAQREVARGSASGFFAASRSTARDAYAEMSAPFIPQVWRWYSQADSVVDIHNKAVKVGTLAGSGMERWLKEDGYTTVAALKSETALVRMLQKGRIQLALSNDAAFRYSLSAAGIAESKFQSVLHSSRPLGVYFGKAFLAERPGFLIAFNQNIKHCARTLSN
ncbi:MAG TPA: transporter substrate-binding domain-containing protein [Magnetospirillum sp.]|nr:transporter substrate-binding domain-containing protein [Magnetospirillum sp.]